MQLAAHFAPERLVDDLVLLHTRLAAKGFGNDSRRVMVTVTGEIADRHLGVRNAGPDQPLDIAGSHRHDASLSPSATAFWRLIRSLHRGKVRPRRNACASALSHRILAKACAGRKGSGR